MKRALIILLFIPLVSSSQSINRNEWKGIKSITTPYFYYYKSQGKSDREMHEDSSVLYFNTKGLITHVKYPRTGLFLNWLCIFFYDGRDRQVRAETYKQLTESEKELDSYSVTNYDSLTNFHTTKEFEGVNNNLTQILIYSNKENLILKTEYTWNYETRKPDTIITKYPDTSIETNDTDCIDERYNDMGDLTEQYRTEIIYDTLETYKLKTVPKKKANQTTAYDSLGNELILTPKGKKKS